METSYSYPDSYDSSPPSRDLADADLHPAITWETTPSPPPPPFVPRLRLMVSFGGLIQLRPHDHRLHYAGGETKLLVLDRAAARFHVLLARIATLSSAASPADIYFKYQLPGEDLDALVSVTNDEDLEHMVFEHDHHPLLNRAANASKQSRHLRLFVFHVRPPPPPPSAALLEAVAAAVAPKHNGQWFLHAVNSIAVPNPPVRAPIQTEPKITQISPDFLFGLDEGFVPPPAVKVKDAAPKTVALLENNLSVDVPWKPDLVKEQLQDEELDSVHGGISRFEVLQEQMKSVKVAADSQQQQQQQQQQPPPAIQRNASEESLTGRVYPPPQPEYYFASRVQETAPSPGAVPGNWAEQRGLAAASGRFPSMVAGGGGGDQPVFLIPAALATGVYPGMAAAQGYYAGVPRVVPADVYRHAAAAYTAYDAAGRPMYYTSAVPTYQTATSVALNQVDAVKAAVNPSQVS